jgi:hypothetical protein
VSDSIITTETLDPKDIPLNILEELKGKMKAERDLN